MEELLKNPYAVKLLQTVVLALVVMALAKLAISVSAKKRKPTSETPYAIKYGAIILFGFALLFIWLEGFGPVLTALTIVAAALTIVAKEMILNFLGSFVIFWRELFAIGDRVQVGDHAGDVIDKGLFYFTLLETGGTPSTAHSTGRLVKVPNALALTLPIINATRGAGYVWNEMGFSITRNSDWERARELLLEVVNGFVAAYAIDFDQVKQSFERRKVYFNRLTPKVYVSVSSGGIRLTLRYICKTRMIRESEDYISTGFLKRLEPGVVELSAEQ